MRIALIALPLAMTSIASAGLVWDEAADGDLSTDPLAPTSVSFSLGSNVIDGDIQSPADTRDYITFVIPAGQALSELNLLVWEDLDVGGPANTGFNAINAGATSLVPSGGNSASFLGGNHVDGSFIGADMLPGLAAGALSGTGFVSPLGPGTYSYLIQQTGTQHNGYSLEFVLVPSPASGAGVICAMGLVAARRRRH